MAEPTNQINQLLDKLEILLRRQDDFSREIFQLKKELTDLKNKQPIPPENEEVFIASSIEKTEELDEENEVIYEKISTPQPPKQEPKQQPSPPFYNPPKGKSDLEKFIGENLINKIGIAITVIGVFIGAKYSIENNLISPLTRIILGYVFGLGLVGFGFKLKANYESYSAVLVSGAIAILYFITYIAYGFYDLFPQAIAFLLMVVFTVFTVTAALQYNKQLIAIIGLVGAYAVPFLLSNGTGNVAILFSYVLLINIGILVIAFKKYWKLLSYTSFGFTWLIFFSWYVSSYITTEHFGLALLFLTLFFILFYLTFLANKLIQNEQFEKRDVILIMLNSFVFYGIGYSILSNHPIGNYFLGLFTVSNAIIHSMVSLLIYKKQLADKNLFYLIMGLVLIFCTIAIPVQLNGNWVTLLWAGEAALLFWLGRTKNVPFYEKISYPLMGLAFFSLVQDWSIVYDMYEKTQPETRITPLLNVNFLTSILCIAAFGFINLLNQNKKYTSILETKNGLLNLINYLVPGVFIFMMYQAFRLEIANYFDQLYKDSLLLVAIENDYTNYFWNTDLQKFKDIWLLNYTLFFVAILSIFNCKKLKNQQLALINLGLIVFSVVIFLTKGLYELSELRMRYLTDSPESYYHIGTSSLWIRYISFLFVSLAIYAAFQTIRQEFLKKDFKVAFDIVLHTCIIWIASSELIHWMDLYESSQSYKLGLSILWGMYALFLIAFGIWKKNKPIRIGGIALFGGTLVKLFFYDISHLNTISKTIVFVSLGILLLIISFLYNKYKHLISDDENETN